MFIDSQKLGGKRSSNVDANLPASLPEHVDRIEVISTQTFPDFAWFSMFLSQLFT